jgi:hypothetical protein
MSKINQIQQALLAIDPGKFQKLADAYLKERGFDCINSIGSVIGADKVRTGTPDTLIKLPNGNFVFAEHTTEQNRLQSKLMGDLYKCLDEIKTGIPVDKIERVIFCFTSKSDTSMDAELARICQHYDVNLDLFGIDTLAFDLYLKYPGLSRDFLGIEIDTGQIVSPDQFVTLYNNNRMATRIDLSFHFREEDLERLLYELNSQELVVLTGRAGVGKTRLALEACKKFSEFFPDFELWCIFRRERDLWEDLRVQFSKPGKFLIFVDDANRISRFEYLTDLVQHQREDQNIKVIATVRDYAVQKVIETAKPIGNWGKIEIGGFTEEQIKGLIKDEYGIHHHLFLDRIAEIAIGNPRLAVMAAEIAVKEGSFESISNVSNLYDNYFSSIRKDIQEVDAKLMGANLLRVAGIISFFKTIDRTNQEMMEAIEEAFDITTSDFWEAADRFHSLEVFDMYENDIVRVADQVLATYLFYLSVFKEQRLSFEALIRCFFPKFRHRLIDTINPILSAFDHETICLKIKPQIDAVYSSLEAKDDEEGMQNLLEVFWFVSQTDTLIRVQQRISKMEVQPTEPKDLVFEKGSNHEQSSSILSILKQFAFAELEKARIAIDLILQYLSVRPKETPYVLALLSEDYGFQHTSYLRNFEIQRSVIDAIWNRVERGEALFSDVFLAVVKEYLPTHFDNFRMKDARMIQFLRFDLPATQELIELRRTIWERLIQLYENTIFREKILNLIHEYSNLRFRLKNHKVVRKDAEIVLPFLETVLVPDNYQDCVIFHDYANLLEAHGLTVREDVKKKFTNSSYRLSRVLFTTWNGIRTTVALDNRGASEYTHREFQDYGGPYACSLLSFQLVTRRMSFEECEDHRMAKIESLTSGYTFVDYCRFFECCLSIRQSGLHQQNEYPLQTGVCDAVILLSDKDSDLFVEVMEYYLSIGDPLILPPKRLVSKLVEQNGVEGAFCILNEQEYPTKDRWLFSFHEALPIENVNERWITHLLSLYETADAGNLTPNWDYLLKFTSVDHRVVAKAVSAILSKVESDVKCTFVLNTLFNPHEKISKRITELFSEDFDLLKQAYTIIEGTQHHSDHAGRVFNQILDIDSGFASEYIDSKFKNSKKSWLDRYDDTRDYSFIWQRDDYQSIMRNIVDAVYSNEKIFKGISGSYLEAFFGRRGKNKTDHDIEKRQDGFLSTLIAQRHQDNSFMEFLSRFIAEYPSDRRLLFVEAFVHHNKSFKDFEKLVLEPSIWSGTGGSWVPELQERKKFWAALLPMMNSIELLQHRQYIERQVNWLRDRIEKEKRADFMGD